MENAALGTGPCLRAGPPRRWRTPPDCPFWSPICTGAVRGGHMSEEHKESLESLPKPRQILTDPAKSCQLQPATDLSVASAGQEPALTQSQRLAPRALLTCPTHQGRRPATRRQRALDPPRAPVRAGHGTFKFLPAPSRKERPEDFDVVGLPFSSSAVSCVCKSYLDPPARSLDDATGHSLLTEARSCGFVGPWAPN